MNNIDYLRMLVKDMDRDFNNACKWVWGKDYIRIPLTILTAVGSMLYWVTSLWYIISHLYLSPQHLTSLILIFIGSFGVCVWCVLSLIRKKK